MALFSTHSWKAAGKDLKSFVVPARALRRPFRVEAVKVCAIIATYGPGPLARRLVDDLLRWNPNVSIYIVDDCTPRKRRAGLPTLKHVAAISDRIQILRTPRNKLKAGALNYALKHIAAQRAHYDPDVILTIDDDVVIGEATIRNLVAELMSCDELGAVCSQCRVLNKNKNLLTRLQGLEYVGFNAIRLADEGFLRGPLVMHGMLTAFRASALWEMGGFAEAHLIEDYEITTRLKAGGWSVRSAPDAPAWTFVPETLAQFWRQRTRWSYGGITVDAGASNVSSVFQDVLGHATFLSTIAMVLLLFFSRGSGSVPSSIASWIIALSFVQLGVWYAFQLWLMRAYEESDVLDWLIRASLVPEFIYSYAMTFALIGSYCFLSFNILERALAKRGGLLATIFASVGGGFFRAFGYTERKWGTRVAL